MKEGRNYSLNNDYLSPAQKTVVEMIWQFPFGSFHYAVAFFGLIGGKGIVVSYLWATGVSFVAWIIARLHPKPPPHAIPSIYGKGNWARHAYWRFWVWFSLLFGGWGGTLVCLTLATTAAILSRWDIAIYLGLAAFGLTALAEAPLWLWGIGDQRMSGGGRMSPKYAIAKRMFGITFPFETP